MEPVVVDFVRRLLLTMKWMMLLLTMSTVDLADQAVDFFEQIFDL